MSVGLPAPLSNAVDVWSAYADGKVSNVVKAQGLVRFALRVNPETGRRVVEPRHYVIDFPLREEGRRGQKHQSALFTLRVVREEEISRDPSEQWGAVANHLRFKSAAERKLISGADEYVEFELLSREHEVPSQQPLRISMGPVRANKHSGQQEFVRVDMGQCIQRIATDIVEDHRGGQRLVQNRWWMCIETLRLLCNVDHIDCTALDKVGVPPQEWVIRLMDTHAPINRREELKVQQEDRDIDDLMQFIDNSGPGRGSNGATAGVSAGAAAKPKAVKPKKKKTGKEKDEEATDAACTAPAQANGTPSSPGDALKPAASRGDTKLASGTASGGELASAGSGCAECIEADSTQFAGKTGSDIVDGGSSPPPPTAAGAGAAPPASLLAPVRSGQDPAPAATSPMSAAIASRPPPPQDSVDVDLMSELLARYRRLQEHSGRVEIDAKISVVRDLLEVFDELEHADADSQEDTAASRKLFAATRKFELKLRGLGLERVETLGKPFDLRLHRVVGETPPSEDASQVVVEELESGWVFGKELVRPALVTLA